MSEANVCFDGFSDKKTDVPCKVVVIENAYARLEILPGMGGKIWDVVDKRTGKPL